MQRKALSSSPPEGSKVMQEQPRATPGREIILFTELEKEESKLRHSRTWGRNHLKLLGVDFYAKRRFDLNRVLKVKETDWSQELKGRNNPVKLLL